MHSRSSSQQAALRRGLHSALAHPLAPRFPLLLLAFLPACVGPGHSGVPPGDLGVQARIVLLTDELETPDALSKTPDRVGSSDVREQGAQVSNESVRTVLSSLVGNSGSSFGGRKVEDGPIFLNAEEGVRTVRLQQILTFDSLEHAEEVFDLTASERSSSPDDLHFVAIEASLRLVPSKEAHAMRIHLQELFVRRAKTSITGMIRSTDDISNLVVSFTLRYVSSTNHSAHEHTVVFQERVDARNGDHRSSPTTSDWLPVEAGPQAHSLQVGCVSREELDGWLRTLADTGDSIIGLLSRISLPTL